jgi:hypothetical protein
MDVVLGGLARESLDAADAGGDGALGHDLEQADVTGGGGVGAAAELHGVAEADHADGVADFSPNRAIAPIDLASSIVASRFSQRALLARMRALTLFSVARSSSSVILAKCEKSKRK